MVFRQIMLGWRTQYFNTPIQRNIAQASSFRNSQVTGVLNLSIYSCFPAYLASFSESGKTKHSYNSYKIFRPLI